MAERKIETGIKDLKKTWASETRSPSSPGAGISAESGYIPTFRGEGGLWEAVSCG